MKTFKIIVGSLIFSLVIVGIWWFGFHRQNTIQTIPATIKSFFPLGTNGSQNTNSNDNRNEDLNNKITTLNQIRLVFDKPVNSFSVLSLASSTLVFFTDQDKGNVYFWNNKNNEVTRLSNDITLNSREILAITRNDLTTIYIQSLTDKNNYQYKKLTILNDSLLTDSQIEPIKTTNLPNSIQTITANKNNLLLIKKSGQRIFGSITDLDLSNEKPLFNSILTDFFFNFTNDNNISLTTKASYAKDGFAFILKNFTDLDYLIVNKKGLATLTSPNGKILIYSISNNTRIDTFLYNLENKQVTKLPFDTLAEKCAWTSDSANLYCGVPINYPLSNYPDDWYSGVVNFKDNIVGLKVTNPTTFYTIFNLQDKSIDIDKITIADDERTILFLDKNTNNLWLSELTY